MARKAYRYKTALFWNDFGRILFKKEIHKSQANNICDVCFKSEASGIIPFFTECPALANLRNKLVSVDDRGIFKETHVQSTNSISYIKKLFTFTQSALGIRASISNSSMKS